MNRAKTICNRIVATFLSSALAVVGGSSLLNAFTENNISVLQSALLAGIIAVAQVVERLARASLDGRLTWADINQAFLPWKPTEPVGKPATPAEQAPKKQAAKPVSNPVKKTTK